jgi:hypothetical protein
MEVYICIRIFDIDIHIDIHVCAYMFTYLYILICTYSLSITLYKAYNHMQYNIINRYIVFLDTIACYANGNQKGLQIEYLYAYVWTQS